MRTPIPPAVMIRPAHEGGVEGALLAIVAVVFVWSGISPHDRFTWVMEVFPVILAIPALIYYHPQLRFTPLVYTLIALHAIILMVGGKYTYAEVPLGFWMERTFHFARNHYDRIGHFAQGFVTGGAAEAFLGTQGDPWDTRWDMMFALIGAITALVLLSRWHDRQLRRLASG